MMTAGQLKTIQKILVISLTNLGDVILTTPVLSALRANFPEAFISVLIGPKADTLFQGSRTVDQVIIYNKRALTWKQKIDMVRLLRKKQFDLVIDLRNTFIPYLIQARFQNSIFFRSQAVSMRKRHLDHLNFLGLTAAENHFDFFSEDDVKRYQIKLKENQIQIESGFVVIAPGAGSYLKRWKIDRFQEVAQFFSEQGKQVILAGSEEEKALGDDIKKSNGLLLNACGLFSLRELSVLLKEASFVLACDSAIMHLANELRTPVVSIFGPTDSRKYAGEGSMNRVIRRELDCSPCELAHCKFERQHCLEDISSREVIKTCEEFLYAAAR